MHVDRVGRYCLSAHENKMDNQSVIMVDIGSILAICRPSRTHVDIAEVVSNLFVALSLHSLLHMTLALNWL